MRTQDATPVRAPLYARVLRLKHVRVGGFASFALFECVIALGVLLALAELVTWWAVPALPAAVAGMVKVNDLVIGSTRLPARVAPGGAHAAVGGAHAMRSDAGTGGRKVPTLRPAVEDETRLAEGAPVARPPVAPDPGDQGPYGAPAGRQLRQGAPPSDERPPVGVFRITVPARRTTQSHETTQTDRRSGARHAQQAGPLDDEAVRARSTLNQGRFA